MHSYAYGVGDKISPNPASSSSSGGDGNSSSGISPRHRFPSTVVLDYHNVQQPSRSRWGGTAGAATVTSSQSQGTGPTHIIDTSPLSDGGGGEERYDSPVDALHQFVDERQRKYHFRSYDDINNDGSGGGGSHHSSEKRTVKTKNTKRGASRHRHRHRHHRLGSDYGRGRDTNAGRRMEAFETAKESPPRHHVETERESPLRHDEPESHRSGSGTLTWRMDPSLSLSDFALTVIGIDDEIAIDRYLNAKKKRRKKRRNKIKRRDKWMVEGLYLDMSESDEEEAESGADGGRGDDDDEDEDEDERNNDLHGRDRGRRGSDDVVRMMHSTIISGRGKTTSNHHPVVRTYHLHKVNLAVGARACDYFARLFRKKKKKKDNGSKHSIELPLSCLSAIPIMLDYLYHHHPDSMMTPVLPATTATAVPLRYLAALLGNRTLFDSATRFLHADLLRPESAVECLRHAELYRQDKLAEVCVRICAENFGRLKITWLASLAPHSMNRILRSRHFVLATARSRSSSGVDIDDDDDDDGRRALCSKIASYCRCQLHKIDREMLLALTDARVMPLVCPNEALYFIKMMVRLGIDVFFAGDDVRARERSLYERCVDAAPEVVLGVIGSMCRGERHDGVAGHPNHGGRASQQTKNACGDYSSLPPQIKVDLLEYALAKQQQQGAVYDR